MRLPVTDAPQAGAGEPACVGWNGRYDHYSALSTLER